MAQSGVGEGAVELDEVALVGRRAGAAGLLRGGDRDEGSPWGAMFVTVSRAEPVVLTPSSSVPVTVAV